MVVARSAVDIERLTRLADCSTETAATVLESSRTRVAIRVLSRCEPPLALEEPLGLPPDGDGCESADSRDPRR